MQAVDRYDRFHLKDRPPDQRTKGQRDRDRILYTSCFRRLAGVTQVAASAEGEVFHNRLTHTLEVAQIARRLAEKLLAEQGDVAEALGGIEPDVVEAAALAHDLGHPPFGHIAAEELDELVKQAQVLDGFEGNPQSFRIVTKLAVRHEGFPGLNLTRATLNGLLKYPWLRETGGGWKERKYGAYHAERDEFDWARKLYPGDDRRSVEAELMDWADDIAFAVHDVEDFYRGGLVPLDRLVKDDDEVARFLDGVFERWRRQGRESEYSEHDLRTVFSEIVASLPLTESYSGTRSQRSALRSLTAGLISRYVGAIRLRQPAHESEARVNIEEPAKMEITMWKELTWHYVINNPSLATQQHGQRRVIRDLFKIFLEAASSERDWTIFPAGYRDQLERAEKDSSSAERERVRTVADLIAGMTEQQAFALYQRLTGVSLGSVLETIVR